MLLWLHRLLTFAAAADSLVLVQPGCTCCYSKVTFTGLAEVNCPTITRFLATAWARQYSLTQRTAAIAERADLRGCCTFGSIRLLTSCI